MSLVTVSERCAVVTEAFSLSSVQAAKRSTGVWRAVRLRVVPCS